MKGEKVQKKSKMGKVKTNKSDKGVGGCFKHLARSLLIHAGCIHSPSYDDTPTEDLNSHPHHHHHNPLHTTVHPGGGLLHHQHNYNQHHHHHHHHHHHPNNNNGSDSKPNHIGVGGDEKEKDHNKHNMISMLSSHNSTLHSDKVRGESYWASFHEKSFYKGQNFKLYKGIINGNGPQSGSKCVVKVFANKPGTEDLCKMEASKSEKFRELIRAFNKQLSGDNSHQLRVTRSYWAPIDEVSTFKQLFFTGGKKLHIGEAVLFEQDVRVSDYSTKKCKVNTFVDQSGKACECSSYSSLVNALVHFSYHHTNGELVICGLNGTKDDGGFFFTTPIIHSKKLSYGHMDKGERGIECVLKNHTCGQLCEELFDTTNFNIPSTTPMETSTATRLGTDINGNGNGNCCRRQSSNRTEKEEETDFPDCKNGHVLATSPCSVDSLASCPETSDSVFLEPSAPTIEGEEINGNTLPPPPPYTPAQEARVALWIIGEESQNTFVQFSPNAFLPRDSVTMASSIECHSNHTARTVNTALTGQQPNAGSVIGGINAAGPPTTMIPVYYRSPSICTDMTPTTVFAAAAQPPTPDVNANFNCHNKQRRDSNINNAIGVDANGNNTGVVSPERKNTTINKCATATDSTANPNPADTTPNTTTTTPDSTLNRPISKQVRFDLQPSYQRSVTTNHSTMCDDVTMESCTNPTASVSSSPSLSRSQRTMSQDAANNNTNNNSSNANHNSACQVQPSSSCEFDIPTDLPPPYDEHDVATANWLLDSRGGLGMYGNFPPGNFPPVVFHTSRSDNSIILRPAQQPPSNYSNNDNAQNNDARNSAGSVFFAFSPTDPNACNGRFY